jgi:hypothetical protein
LILSRPGWPSGKPADEVRIEVRTLVAIMIMVLMATSSAFARKTSHHNFKRAAIDRQPATKPNSGALNAIQTTSRLIERSEAFAAGARRPQQDASLRLDSSGR